MGRFGKRLKQLFFSARISVAVFFLLFLVVGENKGSCRGNECEKENEIGESVECEGNGNSHSRFIIRTKEARGVYLKTDGRSNKTSPGFQRGLAASEPAIYKLIKILHVK